jgi:hypothetical protein
VLHLLLTQNIRTLAESKDISTASSADVIFTLKHYDFVLLEGDKEEPLPEPTPGASYSPKPAGAVP